MVLILSGDLVDSASKNEFRAARTVIGNFISALTKEKDCGILRAVNEGKILKSRHNNYVMFYDKLKMINDWERNK